MILPSSAYRCERGVEKWYKYSENKDRVRALKALLGVRTGTKESDALKLFFFMRRGNGRNQGCD
jgi:hypothetical protein